MGSNTPWKDERWLPGVLNKDQIISLSESNVISDISTSIDNESSALDLHLSSEVYIMKRGSIKPFKRNYQKLLQDQHYAERYQPSKDGSFLLERGHCYVFKLKERLLPYINQTKFFGQSTAKSTVGRLDLIARLIVDGMSEYENFVPGIVISGILYLEVSPITFNVKVKEDSKLSQLRFFYGEVEDSLITNKDFIKSILNSDSELNVGTLCVDLSSSDLKNTDKKAVAFCAKKGTTDAIELWEEDKYYPNDFWEIKSSDEIDGHKSITIDEDRFYILRSKERISLPPGVCIYCRAMDETLGEMRIHYAGFVHPYFGLQRTDKEGTPLIFEVRGHNVKVLLTDKEILARLYFYRMSEAALKPLKMTSYSSQELTLSKIFKENWDNI